MPDFYRMSVQETLDTLQTRLDTGLNEAEVQKRRETYGKNALPTEEGASLLQIFLGQFTDIMVLILIGAALISLFLGETTDSIVILIIVVLNAALGTYQEFRAEQSLAALSRLQVPVVRVRRAGEIHQINAEELVPGDIVLLEEGDRIPADGRLLESVNMQVEEAALTGESAPVEKSIQPLPADKDIPIGDRTNSVFMGTAINYGRGSMVVTDIGLQTQLGNIASMLMQVEAGTTPLQRRLNRLGQTLATAAFALVALVFVAGLLRGIEPETMFLTAISLAVAAVPEGLPAVITIGLSLGAARMVRRNALIRRLPAVETLGSVTIICSDKTGTLTKNEMTATQLALPGHDVSITGIGYMPSGEFFMNGEKLDPTKDKTVRRFLKAMTLSTNATLDKGGSNGRGVHVIGDTTEGAMIVAAEKVGWTRTLLEQEMPRVAELPFSSERKAMTTIHRLDGDDPRVLFPENSYISITKGAPDRLLEWATHEHVPSGPRELSDERRQKWAAEIDSLAAKGLRVLGVAYRPMDQVPDNLTPEVERQLTLLGLVGIVDPARPEAKDAVRVAREAGIRSIMITGDHALTAEAIATNLGIIEPGQKAITGSQLDTFSDSQLVEALRTTSAFARVSPEHKLRIVRVLKAQNEVVAMTGDGVNDAPALKQADIGVAMGITGTDVSKGAADMVLTDDNFASIVAAVEEGRTIYDNIRKFVKYLLSSNVGEIMVMFTALMIGLKIPLLAIQILWINLVTDGLPAIALGFEGGEANVMKRKPRQVNESIFAGRMGRHILWVGALIAVLTLGGFIYGFTSNGMDPFSPTLGLAQKSAAEVIEIVGEDVFNEHTSPVVVGETLGEEAANLTWDELSVEQRVELMESDAEGLEEESEGILGEAEQLPRTLAFSVLAFTQMFHVTGIHGGDRSYFFRTGFRHNRLLLYAILSTFVLQLIVIYTPLMQSVFGTVPLSLGEVVFCVVISSVVLLAVEAEKFLTFGRNDKTAPPSPAG